MTRTPPRPRHGKRDHSPPPGFPSAPPDPLPDAGRGEVAVVVPLVTPRPSVDEALSLFLLRRHLGGIDRVLLVPQGLALDFPHDDFRVLRVPDACMAGIAAYNRLMLSGWFYRIFAGYRFILIHQLDCLLFDGGLDRWCRAGWSYLGAPWYARGPGARPVAVGNGGLSLRRIDHAIAVLESDRLSPWPRLAQQRRHFARGGHLRALVARILRARRAADGRPLAERYLDGFDRPEDEFWAYHAPFFLADYRLPAPEEALAFAVEAQPAVATARLGGRLPFGCHAWARMDRGFWLDRLAEAGLPEDAALSAQVPAALSLSAQAPAVVSSAN